jgi:hypothetical protein
MIGHPDNIYTGFTAVRNIVKITHLRRMSWVNLYP